MRGRGGQEQSVALVKSNHVLVNASASDNHLPSAAHDEIRTLISAIGMDIGKEVVHHIEVMFPAAIAACPSTFPLSVRNCIHNEIVAAFDANNVADIGERLRVRKEFRRYMKAAWKKIREHVA